MLLSIICAYNDTKIRDEWLLQSLKTQKDVSYETVLVNAEEHGFTSASQTLNYGAALAKGDFFVFVHQDVRFEADDVLKTIASYLETCDFGIAGVAGVALHDGHVQPYTKIIHGKNREAALSSVFNKPVVSESLDECLFIVPKAVFSGCQFSDYGSTWHLYATDLCCQMRLAGKPILTLPVEHIWHASDGASFNVSYFETIRKMAGRYRGKLKMIYTNFGQWPTAFLKFEPRYFLRKWRFVHKGIRP